MCVPAGTFGLRLELKAEQEELKWVDAAAIVLAEALRWNALERPHVPLAHFELQLPKVAYGMEPLLRMQLSYKHK